MKLQLRHLSKQYGTRRAVDDINICLAPGVYGLLGANGAGKTTLMRMICGVLKATSGTIADTILMMKNGSFLLQELMATVTDSIRGKVWEVLVEDYEAAQYSEQFSVVNLHHEDNLVRLRIIDETPPSSAAVSMEPGFEDLFLYYFGEEVQEEKKDDDKV